MQPPQKKIPKNPKTKQPTPKQNNQHITQKNTQEISGSLTVNFSVVPHEKRDKKHTVTL